MKISTLIKKLSELLETEGDKNIVIDQRGLENFIDIVDVCGQMYSNGNKSQNLAYLIIEGVAEKCKTPRWLDEALNSGDGVYRP